MSSLGTTLKRILTTLLMGALLALAIDGSPVAIIHLLLWLALYALILALTVRSATPVILFDLAITSPPFWMPGIYGPCSSRNPNFLG